jgi:hydrogenase maturation protein HypF
MARIGWRARTIKEGAAEAVRIRVRGIVQGVGFRSFVYRLARACKLCGGV